MSQNSQRRKQKFSSATSTSWEETLRYASPQKSATDALPGKAGLITEWVQQQKGTSTGGSSTADTYSGPKRTTWTYDAHANVTADPQGGLDIAWNAIDLPRTLTTGSGTGASSTQRAYLADGTLAQVSDGTTTRLYLGDIVFNKASNGTVTLESAGWEGGRLLPGSGSDKVLYAVADHLGSVRVVKDGTGNIRQRFDYYPYGTVSYVWTNSSTTDSSEKRYRFGGKEIAGSSLTDLAGIGAAPGASYLDFGARLYSPRTATWLSPDPLMENNRFITPYAYGFNNPINTIDANGEFPTWLISAGLEYGFQVLNNYRYGYRGYDMWVGNVDFADVALSAIVPTGRLAIAKTFVLESAKAGVEFTTNNGFQQQNDIEHSLKQAVVATVTDAAVGSAINKSNNAVENAARQVEKTSEKAMHTANIASNRPSSTTRAKAAERAAVEAQEARTQQVGNKIVNTIIATSPETTSKVVGKITQDFYSDYDKNKEYKMAFPIFGQ